MSGSGVHFLRAPGMTAVTSAMIWMGSLLGMACIAAEAQTSPTSAPAQVTNAAGTANPSFDVASIRVDNSDHTARTHIYTYANQGHLVVVNASLMDLLQFAYTLPGSRIVGAPDWARSIKFDIEAKSDPALVNHLATLPASAARLEMLEMAKTLFSDRFHLAVHMEKRQMPVYDLVVAKGGPKFASAENQGTTIDSGTHNGTATVAIRSSSHATADLAEILAGYVGRVVVDRTELKGSFTLALHFSANDRASIQAATANSATDDPGPSVFTALKEQLGLELKSAKAPVDILVIDRVERPTAN